VSRCTPGFGWTSRKRRAFKQSRGLGIEALREAEIEAIKKAGVDDAYAERGRVTNETLLASPRKRRAAALGWLAGNPNRVLSAEAFDQLGTGKTFDDLHAAALADMHKRAAAARAAAAKTLRAG